jgi:L-alanine-DL-glutamate epimerase-like enolase superfamily enzyme
MSETIASVEVFPVALPRETPYLGPLESGNRPNEKGYFVRPGNSSIYSIHDQSVLVKVTSSGGAVGWGECVGFVGPQVSTAVLTEILGPFVRGRDPHDVVAIYEDCYNLMRVRGFFGGYYHDAIAALDIALWDLRGKLTNLPIRKLLGGTRHERLPAYVSGLPRPTLPERAALAREVIDMGFAAVKFAAAVANEGELAEMRAIREAVGPGVKILIDMHWRYTALEAIRLIRQLEAYDLYLAEAPVQPEDLEGQAQVAAAVSTSVGIGEELRTVYEYRPRFTARCMNVIQPEMGRTGITSFWHICQMAQAFHCKVMPHASIGVGLFQAASLQASAALPNFEIHEYQHSIFDKNLGYLTGDMACTAGFFTLPSGPGLGVEPREEVFEHVIRSAA